MADKIILNDRPKGKLQEFTRTVFLEDLEKAMVLGYLGILAPAINYKDFKIIKNRGEGFYLEVEKFNDY
ncbi:MAG: hypothetical protein Q7S14_00140 [bacterium]|nr:hypothetical protein [bacterium]